MHTTCSSRNFVPSTEPFTNQSQNERRGGERRGKEWRRQREEISKKSVPEISIVVQFKKNTEAVELKNEIRKERLKNTQTIKWIN